MKRLGGRTTILGAMAFAAVLLLLSVGAIHGKQDRNEVAKMNEKMKTACVGRFVIDLPASSEVSLSRAFIQGFDITTVSESEEQFKARVAAHETEIGSIPNSLGRKNLEYAKDVVMNGLVGKMFMYGRWRTYRIEGGQRRYSEGVALTGLVHGAGNSFIFTTKGYDPARASNLTKLISQLRLRGPDEIPTVPGFCIDKAIVLDPLLPEQRERVVLFAGLPGHPDLAIVFASMVGGAPAPGLLARNEAAAASEPFFVRAAFTNLREGKRTINGLLGEELVMRVREPNFTTSFSFDWEMQGKAEDVLSPLLTLELQTGIKPYAGAKPVQSSLSQQALLDLWDKISSTIRLRPASIQKPVKTEPVTPLGTYVLAGAACPQSGWWQCSTDGSGTTVLGGQRQYIKKGQRMPQALLLPPQTMWEKVRGVQRSYESGTPTSWRLADKRLRMRGAQDLRLAQATLPNPANLDNPTASVGCYIKTGESCPASGWWRCEDSNALDGTRWFAQGSLLPVATFIVPSGGFGKAAGGDQVIQRRSGWQLVRNAQAPALHNPESESASADAGPRESDGPTPDPSA